MSAESTEDTNFPSIHTCERVLEREADAKENKEENKKEDKRIVESNTHVIHGISRSRSHIPINEDIQI